MKLHFIDTDSDIKNPHPQQQHTSSLGCEQQALFAAQGLFLIQSAASKM